MPGGTALPLFESLICSKALVLVFMQDVITLQFRLFNLYYFEFLWMGLR